MLFYRHFRSAAFQAAAVVLAILASCGNAQQEVPSTQAVTYDIVSVKPNNSGVQSMRMSTNPGILNFTNVTVMQMLIYAYGIRSGLITGLPGWAESAHFDISAKVVDPDMAALEAMSGKERTAMILPLLADRFGVVVHTETKTLPLYELVVLKGGPKFKAYVPPPGETLGKGPNLGGGSMNTRPFSMTATAIPMSTFTDFLAQQVDKTVADKTGLAGKYDLQLKFTPDGYRMNGAVVDPTDQAPSIYTALEEQLGLKLVPAKGPVVTLVVDQVKVPAEN